jgi:hypothetical protein
MSRNGTGTYSLPAGNPVVPATTISTTWANTTLTDIATALTGSIAADGQTPITGNLDMNNHKIANLTDPVNAQDAATKAYVASVIPDTTAFLVKASNLSDIANATTARGNLTAAKSGANSDITSLTACTTITGLTTALSVAQGGTGSTTLTANNVLLGNGTSALQAIAPSTSGNALVSNGTTWVSSSVPSIGARGQVFRTSGTFTVPANVTQVKVTVVGAGGGGAGGVAGASDGNGGAAGGCAMGWITGLTPAGTVTVTVGAGGTAGAGGGGSGGTGGQSVFSTISANGGGGGNSGTGGTATGGSFNATGNGAGNPSGSGTAGNIGALQWSSGGVATPVGTGVTGTGIGSGGSGGGGIGVGYNPAGGVGAAGMVLVEW